MCDGEDIPDLNTNLVRVRLVANALRRPLPHETDAADFINWWINEDAFAKAIYILLLFFGFEDTAIEVKDCLRPAASRYVVDTDALHAATGCRWPSWEDWLQTLKRETPRMVGYCQSLNMPAVDWRWTIWDQENVVKMTIGHRLRPLPAYQGHTQFDEYVRWLPSTPGLISAMDRWAERVSRSTFLSDMLSAGSIDVKDKLLRPDDINRDRNMMSLYLGIQPDTVSTIGHER